MHACAGCLQTVYVRVTLYSHACMYIYVLCHCFASHAEFLTARISRPLAHIHVTRFYIRVRTLFAGCVCSSQHKFHSHYVRVTAYSHVYTRTVCICVYTCICVLLHLCFTCWVSLSINAIRTHTRTMYICVLCHCFALHAGFLTAPILRPLAHIHATRLYIRIRSLFAQCDLPA
jgi:hypothetical protein